MLAPWLLAVALASAVPGAVAPGGGAEDPGSGGGEPDDGGGEPDDGGGEPDDGGGEPDDGGGEPDDGGGEPDDGGGVPAAGRAPAPERTEFTLVPTLGFSTDTGLGLGALGVLARFDPEFDPYRWRLAWQVSVSARIDPGGALTFPQMDHFVRLERPGLAGGRVRGRLELAFRRDSQAGYYGMGNAAVDEQPWRSMDADEDPDAFADALRHNRYLRSTPSLRGDLWIDLSPPWRLFGGASLSWTWIEVYGGSVLEEDLRDPADAVVERLLVGVDRYGVLEGIAGVMIDTRDHEYAPSRGMLHDLSVRGGPTLEIPGGYLGIDLTARFFAPLYRDRLVVAWRLLGDVLLGRPPLVELARYGGLVPDEGPGGGRAVRGVPAMRYHGKVKVVGNLELRARLWWFTLFKQRSCLGAVAFADAGRVWADTSPDPLLDGTGLGMKGGVGGGLRLQIGETFVVRGDVGVSPDGWGIYLDTDHLF